MTLEDLGYKPELESCRKEQQLDSFDVGRVIQQHKDSYTVKTASLEMNCELIGNLRFTAESKSELPAVGDWVAISEYDMGKGLIYGVLPRTSTLQRQTVGVKGQSQIIATNIDVGLVIQSVNRDFSINRLERYITICNTSDIEPVIILSKIDLIKENELEKLLSKVKGRINNVPVFTISNLNKTGVEVLRSILQKGKTYCFLGSSGVGKSTLINTLVGHEIMETGEISKSIDRGKHVTTRRELIVFEQGILIDNPGMREIGITASRDGLEMTFEDLTAFSQNCRFKNCTHTNENGCAVLEAIENNELSLDTYENYLKMEKERAHFESSLLDKKKKDKDLGKLIKNMKKRHNKY
jgi:ribosome biogenesis GTPase